MTTFTYDENDLDFGTHSLTGDWTLTIETKDGGHSFKLIDAESCLKGVSKRCFALIEEWIEDKTTLVRKAYEDHEQQRCPVSERAAMQADYLRDAELAA